jgi:hypothetical protein
MQHAPGFLKLEKFVPLFLKKGGKVACGKIIVRALGRV